MSSCPRQPTQTTINHYLDRHYSARMGCSTLHAKDIIQILKPAKKIINLMKASILLYFSPPSQLDCPQNDGFAFPPRSSISSRSILSTRSPTRVYLVGCCVQSSIGSRLKPRRNLVYLFFTPQFYGRNDATVASHIPQLYNIANVDFWLVVASPHQLEAIKTYGPVALSILIFSRLYSIRQMTCKTPPTHVPPCRVSSPTNPPPLTPSFG